jgi:hypothetical protein
MLAFQPEGPAMRRLPLLLLTLMPAPLAAQPVEVPAVLVCDPLPPFANETLRQRITITVEGGVARFERVVMRPGGGTTGQVERVEGRVSADGRVVLQGGASAQRYRYTSRYEGRITAEGARLSGVQDWMADNSIGTQSRACRIVPPRS